MIFTNVSNLDNYIPHSHLLISYMLINNTKYNVSTKDNSLVDDPWRVKTWIFVKALILVVMTDIHLLIFREFNFIK